MQKVNGITIGTGVSGNSGTNGTSGAAGTSATSGTSGTRGTSGTSGLNTSTDVQVFTTLGLSTWTKPSGVKSVEVILIGGGGGGGAGRRGAAGTIRFGGCGGGAGGLTINNYPDPSLLGATEGVYVGAGGAGGTVSSDSTNGGNGGNSSDSYFGYVDSGKGNATYKLVANGGSRGLGGIQPKLPPNSTSNGLAGGAGGLGIHSGGSGAYSGQQWEFADNYFVSTAGTYSNIVSFINLSSLTVPNFNVGDTVYVSQYTGYTNAQYQGLHKVIAKYIVTDPYLPEMSSQQYVVVIDVSFVSSTGTEGGVIYGIVTNSDAETTLYSPSGGGAGGGINSLASPKSGSAGGTTLLTSSSADVGGAGGAANIDPTSAGSGTGGAANGYIGRGGGGGGAHSRNGGAGALYGGGGGGGAAGLNGDSTIRGLIYGNGGDGAQGIVVVISYF
jgi:hypothetical protein